MTSTNTRPWVTGPRTVVTVSGNPRPGSRTQLLGESVAAHIAHHLPGPEVRTEVVDLAVLAGELFAVPAGPALEEALVTAASASVLVVATPTYKATYTGLLKAFLDRYDNGGLTGVLAVPVQVAGNPVHLAAADLQLRPLLTELGARVPTRPVIATEAELTHTDELVQRWIDTEGTALNALARAVA